MQRIFLVTIGSLIGAVAAITFFITPITVVAQEGSAAHESVAQRYDTTVIISAFVRDDCKHCIALKAFLATLKKRYGKKIDIRYHNIDVPQEYEKFSVITKKFGLSQGTPITLVGTTLFSGFDTAQTTGAFIEKLIKTSEVSTTFDAILDGTAPPVTVASSLVDAEVCDADPTKGCDTDAFVVRLPFIGTTISLATLPLPAVSLILGLVDGFNPCAMWVLIVFLTLLLQTGSKKRMWQYAGLFILAEAIMYWLILMAWFSTWDFIGLSRIVTPLVGFLALGSGLYFLKRFLVWKPVCSVTDASQQKTMAHRVEKLVKRPLTLATAGGIIMLAFSVNIFEFACSIGIPQAYTKILELNDLGFFATQFQMLLYIATYMIDDIVVFAAALYGAGHLSDTMKYNKWTTLVGAILMIVLGVIMIFVPELLVF